MEIVAFILLGAVLFMYGWNRMGVTDARPTAVVTGTSSFILMILAAFSVAGSPNVGQWAMVSAVALFAGLVTMELYWEIVNDATVGLYSILLAIIVAGIATTLTGTVPLIGAVIMVVSFVLLFLSGIVPSARGFGHFVGWVIMIGGGLLAVAGMAGVAMSGMM